MEDHQAPAADKPVRRLPWNKGKLIGAKPPLRPSHVWSIRTKLQMEGRKRDLALFNLAIDEYLRLTGRKPGQFLFAGRGDGSRGLTTRQYARLAGDWVASIGLDRSKFGTHSLRRTKAVLIYRRTGNLRAVQLLLGHSKIESTVRYLGIEVDDAIEIAEKIDI